jgi:uncharacterized protein
MEFAIKDNYLKLLALVEKELSNDSSHTLDHIQRVWRTAIQIASEEKDVDMDVLKTAVLLHDIARIKEDTDTSRKIDHAMLGAEIAETVLKQMLYPEETIRKMKLCIQTHRFKSGREPVSIEAKYSMMPIRLMHLEQSGLPGLTLSPVNITSKYIRLFRSNNILRTI